MRAFNGEPIEQWREWVKFELLEGGDGTIIYFLPTGGAYVLPGDARGDLTIQREGRKPGVSIEAFFNPAFTVADREKLEAFPGDGPLSIEGTREELYELLGLPKAEFERIEAIEAARVCEGREAA